MGTIVTYATTSDAEQSGYLALPEGGTGPGVLVIQEWWGLVDQIKHTCDRFAAAGFVALAPDLYSGKEVPLDEPSEAAKEMMALKMDWAADALNAAVDHLGSMSAGPTVGVVGFCMGGGLALVVAARRPDAVSAVVPCYGVHPWKDAHPVYNDMTAATLIQCAALDGSFTPEAARELEATLRGLGKSVEVNIYDGADHAFFNEDRPEVYNQAAAERLWETTVAFLGEHVSK